MKRRRLSSFQVIIFGFAGVIVLGAFLLMLPVSSRLGQITPFDEALFTATSAVCVTGLVVQDTATYWSVFGQAVILCLIQIGGMGVITVAASIALISGRKISLMQRSTMQEAIAAPRVGGIVRLTGFIIKMTIFIEAAGAVIMIPAFYKDFGPKGIWMAVFHSISAFCNAGFDVLGTEQAKYVSLTGYMDHPVITVTIMFLIVIGGIGFLTWDDIRSKHIHVKRYRMQSKVILVTTGILILIPAIYFYCLEFSNMPQKERILSALFQAITPRTAGFNTVDLNQISGAGRSLMIVLMLIGGSPGSTAGGMKTTTIAVLLVNVLAVFFRRENPRCFGRRIDNGVVKNAATILIMYITLFYFGAFLISLIEQIPMETCLFETASAIGTVGLTLGITPSLGLISRVILISLMYLGRVGGLTIIFAAFAGTKKNISKLPLEKITVG